MKNIIIAVILIIACFMLYGCSDIGSKNVVQTLKYSADDYSMNMISQSDGFNIGLDIKDNSDIIDTDVSGLKNEKAETKKEFAFLGENYYLEYDSTERSPGIKFYEDVYMVPDSLISFSFKRNTGELIGALSSDKGFKYYNESLSTDEERLAFAKKVISSFTDNDLDKYEQSLTLFSDNFKSYLVDFIRYYKGFKTNDRFSIIFTDDGTIHSLVLRGNYLNDKVIDFPGIAETDFETPVLDFLKNEYSQYGYSVSDIEIRDICLSVNSKDKLEVWLDVTTGFSETKYRSADGVVLLFDSQ